MIKINKKVEYALMALKWIAQKERGALTSAREICNTFNTPFDTTAKVLQIMNNKNILHSTKGIKGGYTLAKPLKEITFMELARLIEAKSWSEENSHFCVTPKGICDLYHSCNIVDPIEQLNQQINQFLENLTLEELLIKESFCCGIDSKTNTSINSQGQTAEREAQ